MGTAAYIASRGSLGSANELTRAARAILWERYAKKKYRARAEERGAWSSSWQLIVNKIALAASQIRRQHEHEHAYINIGIHVRTHTRARARIPEVDIDVCLRDPTCSLDRIQSTMYQ